MHCNNLNQTVGGTKHGWSGYPYLTVFQCGLSLSLLRMISSHLFHGKCQVSSHRSTVGTDLVGMVLNHFVLYTVDKRFSCCLAF